MLCIQFAKSSIAKLLDVRRRVETRKKLKELSSKRSFPHEINANVLLVMGDVVNAVLKASVSLTVACSVMVAICLERLNATPDALEFVNFYFSVLDKSYGSLRVLVCAVVLSFAAKVSWRRFQPSLEQTVTFPHVFLWIVSVASCIGLTVGAWSFVFDTANLMRTNLESARTYIECNVQYRTLRQRGDDLQIEEKCKKLIPNIAAVKASAERGSPAAQASPE